MSINPCEACTLAGVRSDLKIKRQEEVDPYNKQMKINPKSHAKSTILRERQRYLTDHHVQPSTDKTHKPAEPSLEPSLEPSPEPPVPRVRAFNEAGGPLDAQNFNEGYFRACAETFLCIYLSEPSGVGLTPCAETVISRPQNSVRPQFPNPGVEVRGLALVRKQPGKLGAQYDPILAAKALAFPCKKFCQKIPSLINPNWKWEDSFSITALRDAILATAGGTGGGDKGPVKGLPQTIKNSPPPPLKGPPPPPSAGPPTIKNSPPAPPNGLSVAGTLAGHLIGVVQTAQEVSKDKLPR